MFHAVLFLEYVYISTSEEEPMGATSQAKSKFPDFAKFCLEVPLYTDYQFDSSDLEKLDDIKCFRGHLDCFCLQCKQPSVFKAEYERRNRRDYSYYANRENDIVEQDLYCSRNDAHQLTFIFRINNGTITKIGQYPSIADLANYSIQKYNKLLGSARYKEFGRAVGLVSHGIGIGSFVYLRRIMEHLLEEAHCKIKKRRIGMKTNIIKAVFPKKLLCSKMYCQHFL